MTLSQQAGVQTVTVTIDGFEMQVPKGTLIIRLAEEVGIQVPRFCDHPLLDPLGACRQCIVEVEGQRKPVTACTTTVADGMVIRTQLTSPVAEKAQRGVMELLLINHPLDCPICDKGGECPLQNQAMSNGQADSRFRDVKRTFPKPVPISSQVLLDRERCVQCARCTRFSQQIAGDPFIELFERGAEEQVAIFDQGGDTEPFSSYFSGNTVQICPVGALTGAQYRFRARPFDLMSTPSVCEHCASGCAQRTDWRRGKVMRRLAGEDHEVNEEWNCDKGRWAFQYATATDRILRPLVRKEGELVEASWSEALVAAATGLRAARETGVGVLPGGRLTMEDAYAYAKFARVVLGTNDVDMRARPHSQEELEFLAARVAGTAPGFGTALVAEGGALTYTELEAAPTVLLAGFDPEEESPIVFLRLRKAALKRGQAVHALAPFTSDGLRKVRATLVPTAPGAEAHELNRLATDPDHPVAQALRQSGAVILVGERLAEIPGALSAAATLASASGARLAWIPRRAGERGALDAGALPTLLPGGRHVTQPGHRALVEQVWGGVTVPAEPGRDVTGILTAARDGHLAGLLVGGVDPDDLPDPDLARAALGAAGFVVSLEIRPSAVTEHADVVLPVAPAMEKAGTYVNWEGRRRPFDLTLRGTGALTDGRVLHALAEELDAELNLPTVEATQAELAELSPVVPMTDRPADPAYTPEARAEPAAGQAVLATWRLLLDQGSLQDQEPHLAGTRREPAARLSAATAAEVGVTEGQPVAVRGARGTITLPARITDMPDRVVWVPANSPESAVRVTLGVRAGAVVDLSSGGSS